VNLGFIHRFIPANVDSTSPPAFLLLHGTGGDEGDLLDLGRALDPNAALRHVSSAGWRKAFLTRRM
jgi:predicted esterase